MGSTMHSPDERHSQAVAARERHLSAVPRERPTAQSAHTPSAADTRMHPIGRAGVIGGALGFSCSCICVFVGSVLAGMKPGDAIGLAVWAGAWGGIGFGAMVGLVVGANRFERRERAEEHGVEPPRTLGRHA